MESERFYPLRDRWVDESNSLYCDCWQCRSSNNLSEVR